MKTWHTCEVCGFSSEDPNEVQACEGQYRTNKYQEGDAVKVALIPHRFDQRDNDRLWLQLVSHLLTRPTSHSIRFSFPNQNTHYSFLRRT